MTVSTDSTAFAGVSSAALKKVHLQRLLAFAVALVACTLASWQLMIACWAITPFTPDRDSGILRDFLSILVRSIVRLRVIDIRLFGPIGLELVEIVVRARVYINACPHFCYARCPRDP